MKRNAILKEIISYIKLIFFTWLTVMITVNFLFRPVVVEGRSMYPTLHHDDFGFSNIIGYKLDGIKRFDIVIIQPRENDGLQAKKYISLPNIFQKKEKADLIVKRLIGLPNEVIEYRDDKLYVDGVFTEEVFLETDYTQEYKGEDKVFTGDFIIQLQDDEYLCLGDNRPQSSDSRVMGPFSRLQIIGKAVYIFYPFNHFMKGK